MRLVLFTVISFLVFLASVPFARAETWATMTGTLQVDKASMVTNGEGFTLYKTRELDADGKVRYQHKEAVQCSTGFHAFRNMYDASAVINATDNSDAWQDWQSNPREVYDANRLVAIRNYICGTTGETGVPICDEYVRIMRACHAEVSNPTGRAELNRLLEEQIQSLREMSKSALVLSLCQSMVEEYRKTGSCY
jgi:hypothetical protein